MLRSPHTNLFFSLSLSLFLSIHLLFQRPLSSLASLGESTLARLTKHMQPKNGPDCREKNAIYFLQASLDDDICACWLYLNTTHLLSPNRGSGERCTRTPWSGLRKPVNFFFLFFLFPLHPSSFLFSFITIIISYIFITTVTLIHLLCFQT